MFDIENNIEYWGYKRIKINFKKYFCFYLFLKNKYLELKKNCIVKRNFDIIFFKNVFVINGIGDLNYFRCNIYVYNFS